MLVKRYFTIAKQHFKAQSFRLSLDHPNGTGNTAMRFCSRAELGLNPHPGPWNMTEGVPPKEEGLCPNQPCQRLASPLGVVEKEEPETARTQILIAGIWGQQEGSEVKGIPKLLNK